jgi:hypothetical protein
MPARRAAGRRERQEDERRSNSLDGRRLNVSVVFQQTNTAGWRRPLAAYVEVKNVTHQ